MEGKPITREKLYADFPEMYKNVRCGFWIADGWLPIVYELSQKLTDAGYRVQVTQVKEKMSTLKFYIGPVLGHQYDAIYSLIDEAEDKSEVTCEECGRPGICREGPWFKTLCDEHSGGKGPGEVPLISRRQFRFPVVARQLPDTPEDTDS